METIEQCFLKVITQSPSWKPPGMLLKIYLFAPRPHSELGNLILCGWSPVTLISYQAWLAIVSCIKVWESVIKIFIDLVW